MSKKPYTSLTFEKRQIIENMAKKKQTPQRIAEATGVHVATIYREMKRGQTKDGYSAIYKTALDLAMEAIQTAAMARKGIISSIDLRAVDQCLSETERRGEL